MCGGDIISQLVVEKRKTIDFKRTARFGLIGYAVIVSYRSCDWD
jgi:hypothetical protein